MEPRIKEWKFMLRRIRQTPLALVGIAIIIFFALVAALAPVLAPPQHSDPFKIPQDLEIYSVTPSPTPPTLKHIFGTTDQEYDIYYACIWGTITAFRVGLTVVSISLVIGLILGVTAAYYGGILDEILMRFTDIIIAFPGLILSMALVLAFPAAVPVNLSFVLLIVSFICSFIFIVARPERKLLLLMQFILAVFLMLHLYQPIVLYISLTNLDKVLIAIAIVGWPGYARLIRGEVLRVKNEDYIEAARAAGSSDFRIITRHILPNTIYPLLVVVSMDMGAIVLTAAALSFLGLGAPIDYADWGQIISRSRDWIRTPELLVSNFHVFFIPGLFITLFTLGWNLLGDALRDVLDPMLRRR
ncbi:MAG: ABC transporter permease [Candidatus Bathyarchaeia archaeon]